MPAHDIYHENVKQALVRDGWIILKEHYELKYKGDRLYPDIAAEEPIVAERGTKKILVEIKSFLGRSFIADLQAAIGQYVMYRNVIQAQGLEFELYLAISEKVYEGKFQSPLAQLIIEENQCESFSFCGGSGGRECMDKLNRYRKLIHQVLTEYRNLETSSEDSDLEAVLMLDDVQGHYVLLRSGWEGSDRVQKMVIHIRLKNGKIWIEEDGTEDGVATDFLQAGVLRDDIVLGFHPQHLRQYTEFAIA